MSANHSTIYFKFKCDNNENVIFDFPLKKQKLQKWHEIFKFLVYEPNGLRINNKMCKNFLKEIRKQKWF